MTWKCAMDLRMSHSARAPSRDCPELRVTLAFKLEPDRTR